MLILRDLLGWPAKDVAKLLDDSVNSVNSALQRARAGMREHLPAERQDWTGGEADTGTRELVRRFTAARHRLLPLAGAGGRVPAADNRCPAHHRGAITEIIIFHADRFPRLGLPERLPKDGTEQSRCGRSRYAAVRARAGRPGALRRLRLRP